MRTAISPTTAKVHPAVVSAAQASGRPAYLKPIATSSTADIMAAGLDRLGTSHTYAQGKMVVEQGDAAEYVFKITSGALRAVRLLPDGRRYVTRFLLPGDFFGLAERSEYGDSFEVVKDATVVRYARSGFDAYLEGNTRAGRHFLGLVCGELTAAQDRLLLLGRKNAIERMATFLLAMADRSQTNGKATTEIELPMNRTDVADYLGLTVETVSRLLTQLRSKRIIDLPSANHVVFRNREALEDMSAGDV